MGLPYLLDRFYSIFFSSNQSFRKDQPVLDGSSLIEEALNSAGVFTKVLSMYVDASNDDESIYRIQFGNQVKYVFVDPGTFDGDTLPFPPALLQSLPKFPRGEWTAARVFKSSDGCLSFDLTDKALAGVLTVWHPNKVEVLSLTLQKRFDARVFAVSSQAVAKIARFEFEIPLVDKETAIYKAISGQGIGPTFLGHLTEHGRVMGLLIERVEGRFANIDDLEVCQAVVKRLHSLGIVHRDLNRYNFIVSGASVTLIDFEHSTTSGSQIEMEEEYRSLPDQLKEETGRGTEQTVDSNSE